MSQPQAPSMESNQVEQTDNGLLKWASVALLIYLLIVAVGLIGAGLLIKIDGSSTVYPITQKAVERFQRNHSDVPITVHFSGTAGTPGVC